MRGLTRSPGVPTPPAPPSGAEDADASPFQPRDDPDSAPARSLFRTPTCGAGCDIRGEDQERPQDPPLPVLRPRAPEDPPEGQGSQPLWSHREGDGCGEAGARGAGEGRGHSNVSPCAAGEAEPSLLWSPAVLPGDSRPVTPRTDPRCPRVDCRLKSRLTVRRSHPTPGPAGL